MGNRTEVISILESIKDRLIDYSGPEIERFVMCCDKGSEAEKMDRKYGITLLYERLIHRLEEYTEELKYLEKEDEKCN